MDVTKFRAFYTVARLGSFSKAAETLFFTQPAISAQIKELENEYNAQLFERMGRTVRLTEAGTTLLPYAETILKTFEGSRRALDEAKESTDGNIRLGASTLPGANVVPELLAEFKCSFPAVTFDITINFASQIRTLVRNNQLDVGIIGCREKRTASLGLQEHTYLKDETVLVVGKQHEWAQRDRVEVHELAGQSFILTFKNTLTRQILEERFRKLRIPLRIAHEIRSTEIIKRMVEQNLGVSVLAFSAVRREVGIGWLKSLPIGGLKLVRYVNFIHHRDRRIPPTLQLFLDFLATRSQRD